MRCIVRHKDKSQRLKMEEREQKKGNMAKSDYKSELEKRNSIMMWLAVIMSALSLLIATASYLRTDSQPQLSVEREWQDVNATTQRQLAQLRAQLQLERLRAQVETQDVVENTEVQISALRRDIEVAFEGLSLDVESSLNQLEQQLRANSTDALLTIESLLVEVRRDVRSDEGNE